MKTPTTTIRIPSRFNGPPTSGNGGYSAGALARLIDGPALVSLRSPPPLDTDIVVTDSGERLEARHQDALIMYAYPQAPQGKAPPPPPLEVARRGPESFDARAHPLPTCFVCGPSRATPDGLELFTGRVDGFDGVADVWTPTADLADETGLVRPEVVWAALDCPSYFSIPAGTDSGERRLALLGSICARVDRRPAPGAPTIVVGWHRRSDGRKHLTASALFSVEGALLAQADTLWVELDRSHALNRRTTHGCRHRAGAR